MSMTSLERCVAAIQFKEADRGPCVPIICGASRRVYGISYAEWAQDHELSRNPGCSHRKCSDMMPLSHW